MQSRLVQNYDLATAILDIVGAVVCVMDLEGKIVFFNQASQKLTGYTENEVLNRYPWDLFILPTEVAGVKQVFSKLSLGQFPNSHINHWLTKSGDKRLISWSNTALSNANGKITYVIATGIDITEQHLAEEKVAQQQKNLERQVATRTAALNEANKKLELMAYEDPLTGLYNRRYFNNALDNEIRRAMRNRYPISLLLCDVDYFKNYNDTNGHVAGDKCLQSIAAMLKHQFQRAGDLVARYGGEEFCVILPDMDASKAEDLSEQLRQEIIQNNIKHTTSPIADSVTISIGVVTCQPEDDCDAEKLIRAADKALYVAKNSGRNCVRTEHFRTVV